MSSFNHPTLFITHIKYELLKRKELLRTQYPNWSDKGISTKAEYDFFFSLWKQRVKKNLPFLLLTAIGTLSLFKEFFWMEPSLAALLSKWTALVVMAFKAVTFNFFNWSSSLVNYCCIGIGMTGIFASLANDVQIIHKSSVYDDPMEHLVLQSGCLKYYVWILYAPIISWFWPFFPVGPLFAIFSSSLKESFDVPQEVFVGIQFKRSLMFLEPFILPVIIWLLSFVIL